MMSIFSRLFIPALVSALCFVAPLSAYAQSAAGGQDQPSEETWDGIKGDIFKNRPVLDGTGLVMRPGVPRMRPSCRSACASISAATTSAHCGR